MLTHPAKWAFADSSDAAQELVQCVNSKQSGLCRLVSKCSHQTVGDAIRHQRVRGKTRLGFGDLSQWNFGMLKEFYRLVLEVDARPRTWRLTLNHAKRLATSFKELATTGWARPVNARNLG